MGQRARSDTYGLSSHTATAKVCMRAWEERESKSQTSVSFQKIVQGPKEPYAEFTAQLQEAVHRQVRNAEVADVILELLAYDSANMDCKKVMNPFKGKAGLKDYVKLCQGVGTKSFKTDLLAQTMAGLPLPKFPSTCIHCGKPEHTILFMGSSRQEYWSGLPFPPPVDHVLSDLSTMTRPSWVAPRGMA